jgi:hypothetical protein
MLRDSNQDLRTRFQISSSNREEGVLTAHAGRQNAGEEDEVTCTEGRSGKDMAEGNDGTDLGVRQGLKTYLHPRLVDSHSSVW